jgi:hypothetical protein
VHFRVHGALAAGTWDVSEGAGKPKRGLSKLAKAAEEPESPVAVKTSEPMRNGREGGPNPYGS